MSKQVMWWAIQHAQLTGHLLLQGKARVEMAKVDLLLVPTALHHYTVQEIYHEERKNDKVGLVGRDFWDQGED